MEATPRTPAPPAMTPLGSVPLGPDGRSEVFSLTLPEGHGVIGILVEPLEANERPDLCFQLEDVTTGAGDTWVPPASGPEEWGRTCSDCSQRVFLTYGSGFYVFPNGAESLPPGVQIHARAALRDCLSRLPVSEAADGPLPGAVAVSWASWEEPDDDTLLFLPIHLVLASDLIPTPDDVDEDSLHSQGIQHASDLLTAAGVALRLDGHTRLADPGLTEISMSDPGPLSDLLVKAALPGGAVPIMLLPCVSITNEVLGLASEPDGFTLRIPGGYGGPGAADAVFVRTTSCTDPALPYWSSATALGTIIAHELGHYLGLYHPPDHLPDTDGGDTLMEEDPLGTANPMISESQRRVLRRHPLLHPMFQGSSEAGM